MEQASAQVDILRRDINLSNDQPTLTPEKVPIENTEGVADPHLHDAALFTSVSPHIAQQAKIAADLNSCVKKAEQFLHVLYAARSLSKAIPQLQSNNQPNKEKLYEESIKILQPEVDRMRHFLTFQEEAIDLLCRTVGMLVESYVRTKRDMALIPDGLIESVIRLFGVLFTVDNLKNVKSAWSNDLSAYKRACSNLRRMDGINLEQQQKLIFFLANNNVIINNTKSKLEEIKSFKEVLVYVSHTCLDRFEHHHYTTPEQKHTYLKCMLFTVFAMDGVDHRAKDKDDKHSILRVKKLKLERILKLFKRWPVIPLVGDMHIDTSAIFRLAPHINDAKMTVDDSEEVNLSRKYEVQYQMKTFSAQHQELMAELALFQVEGNQLPAGDSTAYDLVRKALRTVGNWTMAILEQAAWKYAHPTDEYINRECPSGCTSYEKAVRYNYTRAERVAMIELLAMIKDVQGQLDTMASTLVPAVNTFVHHQVQAVVHSVFQPLLQLANKKKRKEASKVLPGLVNMVSDLEVSLSANAAAQMHIPSTKRDAKKMTRQAMIPDAAISLPVRKCGPTSTQLFFLQAVLSEILHFESGGLLKAKDLSSQQTDALKSLFSQTHEFHDMLDFFKTLEECTDLSPLWYKEFHLELAKEIQFPVEFSLPWILTSTAMTERGLHEHILIPLELYNDAASHALYKLKSQTLYNEIEAEVNLCFDQLMFHISEQVFVNFKAKATSNMLAREAKESSVLQSRAASLDVYDITYRGLLNQRHVRLLGRSVDLTRLIAQGLDALMKRTVGMVLQVFESEDLCSILAFERMLEIERFTHDLMSHHFALTPFEDVLEEQNGSVNPTSNHGRIEHKIIYELLSDITTNFAFDSGANEFFRPALTFADNQEREAPAKVSNVYLFGSKALAHAMQALLDTTKRTFRVEHAAAIVRLVKPHNFAALVNELSQTVGLTLHTVVRPFVGELVKGLPKVIKEPDAFYGREGAFLYYQAKLKPILQYPELSTEVYQEFRNLGNTLCLISLLEQALEQVGDADLLLLHPFGQCDPKMRRLRMPTREQVQGANKALGLKLQGGHSEPVIISSVAPDSIAAMAGLRPGDEILAMGQLSFRQPKGQNGPMFLPHDAAINALRQCLGQEIIVQQTKKEVFAETVKVEIQQLSQACGVDFASQAKQSVLLSDSIASTGSILRGALQTIDKLLDDTGLRKEWAGTLEENEVYSDNPALFYRLWAAINFAQCLPTGHSQYSTQALFGEGLHWGGLMLVYLLGQRRAFDAFHYLNSWLHISETGAVATTTSGNAASVGPIDLDKFEGLVKEQRQLNTKIFDIFRAHYPLSEDRSAGRAGFCRPPSSRKDTGKYEPSAREMSQRNAETETDI